MNNKKVSNFLFPLLIVLSLASVGCSNDYENKSLGESLETVLEKSFEAAKSIENFHLSMRVNELSTEKGKEPIDTVVEIEMDLEMEPVSIYQNLKLPKLPYEMEIYITEEGSFTRDTVSNTWIRTPKSLHDSTIESTKSQYDAITMLENIRKNLDEFLIEEELDYYYISFELTDENSDDHIKEMLESDKIDNPYGSDLDNIKFSSIRYYVIIEKETYYPKEFYIKTNLEIYGGDNPVRTVQVINGKYSKINQIEKITIPKEAR